VVIKLTPTEIKNQDFKNINLKNFELYNLLKNKRYTLTALDNLYKYNQEYLMTLHKMEEGDDSFDYEPYHSRIAVLSDKITNTLNIKNLEDLNKFLSLIRISTRLLRKSAENKDLETMDVSLSTLEQNINLLTITNNIMG